MAKPGSVAVSGEPVSEATLWAAFAHLGGIASVLPSLLIYLAFKDGDRFTANQAREALNFQITLAGTYLATVVGGLLVGAVVLAPVDVVHLGLGVVLSTASVVFSVLGFQRTRRGIAYRYPFCLRLIS